MNNAPKRKYHCRKNDYKIVGDTVYLYTKNKPSVTVIIDKKDLEKISAYSWSAHPYITGIKIIKHRYHDIDGKWKEITLARKLGYSHCVHINGNIYDFRSCNMRKNEFYKYAPNYLKSVK